MSGNPWTPGPWRVEEIRGNSRGILLPTEDAYIGEVYGWEEDSPEEAAANARLIQHAPEMADALEECANRLKRAAIHLGSDEEFAEKAVSRYRALLARIRGDAT